MVSILNLETYAEENHIPIMEHEGIDYLTNYIKEHHLQSILEIGTAIGYSAIKMALINQDIKITTIERDLLRYQEAVKNIKKFKLEPQITLIYGDAFDVSLNQQYDLIFIDAAKSQYIRFFEKFESNLKLNGVIIADNLNFHGLVASDQTNLSANVRGLVRNLKKYIKFLENHPRFKTEFFHIADGISVSIKVRSD